MRWRVPDQTIAELRSKFAEPPRDGGGGIDEAVTAALKDKSHRWCVRSVIDAKMFIGTLASRRPLPAQPIGLWRDGRIDVRTA